MLGAGRVGQGDEIALLSAHEDLPPRGTTASYALRVPLVAAYYMFLHADALTRDAAAQRGREAKRTEARGDGAWARSSSPDQNRAMSYPPTSLSLFFRLSPSLSTLVPPFLGRCLRRA